MPDLQATFKRNAELFATHLSSLLTQTLPIYQQPLSCRVLYNHKEKRDNAFIQSNPQTITFGNGCSIRVLHRVIPNPNDASKVMTANYSYACGFGNLLEDGWLTRYEYVPEQAIADPEYKYSISHVHFNGNSGGYNQVAIPGGKPLYDLHFPTGRLPFEDFIEHLIVELGVPSKGSRKAARDILAKSRKKFKERQTRHN